MGIFNSKKFKKIPEMPPNLPTIIPSNSQKLEDNNLAKMRRQLYNDAPTFILNNLLLSIQFFSNYEKDIADLRMSNISNKENEINSELSKEQKHCLIPDTLHELIDTNVCFQPKHGDAKYYTETLHTQRILISYDNIEVRNPSETSEYSSALDGPIYKCFIEGTELRGYVLLKLKEIEVKEKMNNRKSSEQTIEKKVIIKMDEYIQKYADLPDNLDETDGNGKNLNDDVFIDPPVPLPNGKQNLIRQMSLTKQEMLIQKQSEQLKESDYGYSTITDHYTTKPLKKVQTDTTDNGKILDVITNTIQLPSKCITSVKVKVYRDKIEEEEEKRKLREKYPDINQFRHQMMLRKKHKLYEKLAYLNSIAFHEHFEDTFPEYIGKKLGFTQNHIQMAVMQGAIIYIDVIDKETKHVTNYEVIPSVTSSWPDEAFEWSLRTRPVIQDAKTQTAYRWPTPGMISRVKSFPSYIYPIGFHPKRGENKNRDLQWRLHFPVAERFLESHLHHAQIRCYLITLAYFKSFIESKDTKLGLNADHLRTHLFWECERDYVRWPENRLGEKLIVFLKNLRRHLAYRELPDYFIPTRNLFENIPESRLMIAHRKIVDILENPVMYTLTALRNIKYRKESFYPMFDYNNLYLILTANNNNILQSINPQIPQSDGEENKHDDDSSGDELEPEQRWYRDAYRKIQQEKENKMKNKERKRRISCDSINIEIQPVRTMGIMQQMLVLQLFVQHFIEMARKSNEFNNPQQGLMYLQQAKNLNTLLNEMPSGKEDSIEYASHISKVEESLKITLAKEENLPKIPTRKQTSRITKQTDITNEPKASTTSSDYVNVDQILEKSKLAEVEYVQKRLDDLKVQNQKKLEHSNSREKQIKGMEEFKNNIEIEKYNNREINQNRKISEEMIPESVLTIKVDVHSTNKEQVILNHNNSLNLNIDSNEESDKNINYFSKPKTSEKTESKHDKIILNDDYITRLSSKNENNINENHSNENNLEISDINNESSDRKKSISFSKNDRINELKSNQEKMSLNNHYGIENNSEQKHTQKEITRKSEKLNSSHNKTLNEINQNTYQDNKKHPDGLNEPNKNNSLISFSKTNTPTEIKTIQKEITLNNDYLSRLNSSKQKAEVHQDTIENNLQQKKPQNPVSSSGISLSRENLQSNERSNKINKETKIKQKNMKHSEIPNETSKTYSNEKRTLVPETSNQEVVILNDEYSSRLNYDKNKSLNESSPDDDIIIENKLDSQIIVRSNSENTRSNVNSIILREDSEEFECTEL